MREYWRTAAKDAVDAAIAVSNNVVQTLGLATLGGSSLYVVGRLGSNRVDRASNYFSAVVVLQSAYAAIVAAAVFVFQDDLLRLLAPDISAAGRELLSGAFAWTVWLLLLRPLLTLVSSFATGLRDFGAIQLGAAVERIGAIAGVLLVAWAGPSGYPAGTVIGAAIGSVLIIRRLNHRGIRPASPLRLSEPELRETLKLSIPWMLTSPVFNITSWIFIPLMLRLAPGSYASYGYAALLNSTLITVMLKPLSDWLAPILATAAGNADRDGSRLELNRKTSRATRMSLVMGAALFACSVGFAVPLVGLLYFRGAMTSSAAAQIASLTAILGCGLIGRAVLILCARLFQAQVQTWKYVVIQLFEPIVAVGIAVSFIDSLGIAAVAAGAAASSVTGGLLGLWLIQRGQPVGTTGIDLRLTTWVTFCVILGAALWVFPFSLTSSVVANISFCLVGGMIVLALLFGVGRALGVSEIDELASIASGPLRRLIRSR